jgi:hypothetical protein
MFLSWKAKKNGFKLQRTESSFKKNKLREKSALSKLKNSNCSKC